MKSALKCMSLLLALAALTGVVAACGSAATATPTAVPVAVSTALPAASPTSAQVATAVPPPTSAPTEEPTAARAPEYVGTPTTPDQVPRISIEELKALMDGGANIAILDVRPRESYELGHIKGAVSFPWKPQLTFADVEMLPWGDLSVTYCDCGPGEADSADVALQLIGLDARMEFKVLAHPAIEGWIELGYPTE